MWTFAGIIDVLDNNLHPGKISKLPADYACNKIIHKCVHRQPQYRLKFIHYFVVQYNSKHV